MQLELAECPVLHHSVAPDHYPDYFFNPGMQSDLSDHNRGVGYFTMIAGICVLGNQFVIQHPILPAAALLLLLGVVLLVLLMYAVLTAFSIGSEKPSLKEGINGTWLVATVGTQSVSILSSSISSQFPAHQDVLLFFSLCMYLLGGMLYILVITLIFYRMLFFELKPEAFRSPIGSTWE